AFRTSRFVRSKPDSNKTVFKLVGFDPQSNGTVLATLQAIPHDKFGNFLGPGYEKDLQIKSTEGGVVSPINDRLDGSYEITYRLPSVTSNPTFTLLIMGETVTSKTREQLQTPGSRHPIAVFLDLGGNFPHPDFSHVFDKGFSFNAGLEYTPIPNLALEGIFGYHHFPVKSIPGAVVSDLNVYQFSADLKYYALNWTMGGHPGHLFFNFGPGGYKFSSADTYFGGNVGAGVLIEPWNNLGFQISYNFHAIKTPGAATEFHAAQAGLRFVF